ncbi:MAG TPA: methyltransferase domain-containing protein [Vicinamibacterales bacterium]
MSFACPRCKGAVWARDEAYGCAACGLVFPIVCGIPDFRLAPDPYIGIDADRRKAERLFEAGSDGTFATLVRHYYAVTPEDPPDLAARWIPRALAEPQIAGALLAEYGFLGDRATDGALLDVGCSTGGLLVAARGAFAEIVGVDVALRWLAVGRVRLREAGVDATLVCANAEHLPFPDRSFAAVTCTDTLEHVADARAALSEARRVSGPGARLLCTANNRFAPLPEPNVHLWGVGYLPRGWQAAYVRWRRRDLHPYQIRLRSAGELLALASRAGYVKPRVGAGPIVVPHAESSGLRRVARVYNRARTIAVIEWLLSRVGPKLVLTAAATASNRPPPSAIARDDR